ncbi:MAG: hypothetical protein ACFHU9_03990 [Fluviicola sp.]
MEENNEKYQEIDEALTPFSFMVELLAGITNESNDSELWEAMKVEELRLDFPCELDVLVEDDGSVTIGSAPPTQKIETSFMPVIQNLKMTVAPLYKLYGEKE